MMQRHFPAPVVILDTEDSRGLPGKDGRNGKVGKDGRDGEDGRDGRDLTAVDAVAIFDRDDITNLTERLRIFAKNDNRLLRTITPHRDDEGYMIGAEITVAR